MYIHSFKKIIQLFETFYSRTEKHGRDDTTNLFFLANYCQHCSELIIKFFDFVEFGFLSRRKRVHSNNIYRGFYPCV
jgi:hypothetical protein